MQNKEYRQLIIEAIELCLDCHVSCFRRGMDLALSGELIEVAKVLEPDEAIEVPFDILETMKDPFIKAIYDVSVVCDRIGDQICNINGVTDEELEQGSPRLVAKELKKGNRKGWVATRKQVLNLIFKCLCLNAVTMTAVLQEMAVVQGYKIKHRRARYFYHNKALFTNCNDINIRSFAAATEAVTELLLRVVDVPGFTSKPVVPKVAKYYPIFPRQVRC